MTDLSSVSVYKKQKFNITRTIMFHFLIFWQVKNSDTMARKLKKKVLYYEEELQFIIEHIHLKLIFSIVDIKKIKMTLISTIIKLRVGLTYLTFKWKTIMFFLIWFLLFFLGTALFVLKILNYFIILVSKSNTSLSYTSFTYIIYHIFLILLIMIILF